MAVSWHTFIVLALRDKVRNAHGMNCNFKQGMCIQNKCYDALQDFGRKSPVKITRWSRNQEVFNEQCSVNEVDQHDVLFKYKEVQ